MTTAISRHNSRHAGRQGWWYEAWRSHEAWERYEVPAEQCPRISREFLDEEGFEVVAEEQVPGEILERLTEFRPDVVVLDLDTTGGADVAGLIARYEEGHTDLLAVRA